MPSGSPEPHIGHAMINGKLAAPALITSAEVPDIGQLNPGNSHSSFPLIIMEVNARENVTASADLALSL